MGLQREHVPESHLRRDDDVSYEHMKSLVEKCFDLPKGHVVHHFLLKNLLDSNNMLRDVKKNLKSIIKYMSSTGLLRFSHILTGGSVSFEEKGLKMEDTILQHLKKIPQDPKHRSYKSAAKKILDGLEKMDRPLLFAMLRRLEGKVKEPKFGDAPGIKRRNKTRKYLADKVKKLFDELFNKEQECGKDRAGGELSIRLAKVVSVAVLGLNMLNDPRIYIPDFCGSEVYRNELKEDMLMCIRILSGTKLKALSDNTVKELRTIFDPISDPIVKPQKFQDTVKRWLIENLYEHSEFDKIPDSLKKTVNIIKMAYREWEEANIEVEIVEDLHVYNDHEYADLFKGNYSDESVGECEADDSALPESTSGENVGQDSSDGAGKEQKPVNKYLTIQETCDKRSLEAHGLIGRSIEKLLDKEGAELDASKRSCLRGGRSDHQEDCAANSKKKDESTRLPVIKKRKLQDIVSTEDGLKKREKK